MAVSIGSPARSGGSRVRWYVLAAVAVGAAVGVAAQAVPRGGEAAAPAGPSELIPIDSFLPAKRTPDTVARAIEHASAHSAETGRTVVFGPDTLVTSGAMRLTGGTRFLGAGGVLKRADVSRSSHLFVVAGSDIVIDGLHVDFNGAGAYAAGFAIRSGGLRDLTFRNLHLFDSDEPDPSENYGDRWGILIAPVDGPQEPVSRVRVVDNNAENGIQLTAGYGSRGVHDLYIAGNHVVEPEENGISVVMSGGQGGLRDIRIVENTIVGARGVGIYVGVDRDRQAGTYVRNVTIEGNQILGFSHPRRGTFGILFRAAELGNEGIVIRGNLIDGSGSRNAVGLRLQAKSPDNPNLRAGESRHFSAPVIEGNAFRGVSPAIDLWHTRGGAVVGNDGAMRRFIEVRAPSTGIEIRGNVNACELPPQRRPVGC